MFILSLALIKFNPPPFHHWDEKETLEGGGKVVTEGIKGLVALVRRGGNPFSQTATMPYRGQLFLQAATHTDRAGRAFLDSRSRVPTFLAC